MKLQNPNNCMLIDSTWKIKVNNNLFFIQKILSSKGPTKYNKEVPIRSPDKCSSYLHL